MGRFLFNEFLRKTTEDETQIFFHTLKLWKKKLCLFFVLASYLPVGTALLTETKGRIENWTEDFEFAQAILLIVISFSWLVVFPVGLGLYTKRRFDRVLEAKQKQKKSLLLGDRDVFDDAKQEARNAEPVPAAVDAPGGASGDARPGAASDSSSRGCIPCSSLESLFVVADEERISNSKVRRRSDDFIVKSFNLQPLSGSLHSLQVSFLEMERSSSEKDKLLVTLEKQRWWNRISPGVLIRILTKFTLAVLRRILPSFFDDAILRRAVEGKKSRAEAIENLQGEFDDLSKTVNDCELEVLKRELFSLSWRHLTTKLTIQKKEERTLIRTLDRAEKRAITDKTEAEELDDSENLKFLTTELEEIEDEIVNSMMKRRIIIKRVLFLCKQPGSIYYDLDSKIRRRLMKVLEGKYEPLEKVPSFWRRVHYYRNALVLSDTRKKLNLYMKKRQLISLAARLELLYAVEELFMAVRRNR